MTDLPTFPVDDVTLDLIEHSLSGAYDCDEDGNHILVGADMTLNQLLEFLDGTKDALTERKQAAVDSGDYNDIIDMSDMPSYHTNDVIRALITEVRRLRTS